MRQALMPLVYVGLGGFIGACLRYLTSLATSSWSFSFPYGTLGSNLIGCFVIGAFTAYAVGTGTLSTESRLFLATGVCGGYTTLSSMIYELAEYLRDGELMYASIYFVATIVGAFIMFYLGVLLVGLVFKA